MSLLQKEIELAASTEALEREALQRFGSNAKARYVAELPINLIHAPDAENHRFAAGQVHGGVVLKGDLRNIAGMADEIRAVRGINTPLVAVERANGEIWLKQGFRRLNGAKKIIQDEPTSPLAQRLSQGIPVLIYSGLTPEQERTLVNDQTSKPFSKAEVWNIFREELRGGRSWLNVCCRMYRQIAQVTGSSDKVREIDAIAKDDERQKAIRQWLISFAFQGWTKGLQSGPVIESYWLQTYLWQDKYEGANRPAVVMDTNRQKSLSQTIQEDQTAGEWNALAGTGPRTQLLLDKYVVEDNKRYNADGSKRKGEKEAVEKIRPLKDLKDLIKQEEVGEKLTLLSRVYRILLVDGADPEATRLIRNFDKCRAAFNLHREHIHDSLRSTLALVFDGIDGSEDTLTRLLLDNVVPVEDTEPTPAAVVEPTPAAVVEPVPETAPPVVSDTTVVTGPAENAPDEYNLLTDTETSTSVEEHNRAHDGPKHRKHDKKARK